MKAHPSEHTLEDSGYQASQRELQVTGKQALQRPGARAGSQFRTLPNKAGRTKPGDAGAGRCSSRPMVSTGTLTQPVRNEALLPPSREMAVQCMWRKQRRSMQPTAARNPQSQGEGQDSESRGQCRSLTPGCPSPFSPASRVLTGVWLQITAAQPSSGREMGSWIEPTPLERTASHHCIAHTADHLTISMAWVGNLGGAPQCTLLSFGHV